MMVALIWSPFGCALCFCLMHDDPPLGPAGAFIAKTVFVALFVCGFAFLVCVFLVGSILVFAMWPFSGAFIFCCWLAWLLCRAAWEIVTTPLAPDLDQPPTRSR